MNKPTVMIVEESQTLRKRIGTYLRRLEFDVIETHDQAVAIASWQQQVLALAIIGSAIDGCWDGLDLVKRMRATDKTVPLILITHKSSEARAIAALRLGVNDYFKWPIDYDELFNSIQRHSALTHGPSENVETSTQQRCSDHVLVGNSSAMRTIRAYLPTVGNTDSTVLITGRTGTGKECVARQIHQLSLRRKKPLVCINCAALPETLLESELFGFERGAFTGANTAYPGKLKLAEGGTVFFDEIGDMSPYTQAKVLRIFENKEVMPLRATNTASIDIRVIAATNQNLKKLVVEHKFREDLYYRINVMTIHLTPLIERKEDIPLLVAHYQRIFNDKFRKNVQGFTDEALQCLLHYHWPGNIRELKNVLEAIFVGQSAPTIALQDLPQSIRQCFIPASESFDERALLLSALSATNWNKSKAAEKLHWSRMTVYRKIAKYHLAPGQHSHDSMMRTY